MRAAWYWENRKAPNRWYWVAVTILCSLGSLSGYLQYRTYRSQFEAQGVTWEITWSQSTLLLSMLFLPLALGAFAAQIASNEHQGRNWQRMSATGLETAMVAGKLLHGLQVAALTTTVLALTTAVMGLALGFNLVGLVAYLPRFAVVALGMWVILTFVTWLGAVMTSFATTMSTVLLSIIAGMAMLLVARPLSILNPAASLTRTTSAMSPGYVTSLGAAAFEGVVCLVWVVLLALALRRAVRRQS
ncbi:ABC transporter permease [Actinomyces sp. CCUG 33915]|uniref:ABC transporter permease n=1 Tax=Actinomyces sp. CCUG 33915 TaxID=2698232 RepID=UPI002FE13975